MKTGRVRTVLSGWWRAATGSHLKQTTGIAAAPGPAVRKKVFLDAAVAGNRMATVAGFAVSPSIEPELTPGEKEGLRRAFAAFKAEILSNIEHAYLLAIPVAAMRTIEGHAVTMGVEPGILFEAGPILAAIRDKADSSVLSIQVNRIEGWATVIERALTRKELFLLELLSDEAVQAGYTNIRPLLELPGVSVLVDARTKA